ncbi:hypothetical protein EHF33_14725 [Deinococcus psychrotolerans]|uniref:Sucrose phosphatase-like domain-containing protein n=2 Tax=Deinococcus psychrotolerans TaxID=2489213 RepID=A0A3G8YRP1_9DEIO|nr:hypothetical protein EHF33_14725 [Deinococcus psychrotolerans]
MDQHCRIVVFADLDDTLFQTRRKLRGDEGVLTPATVDTRGEPHSFQTPAQAALLDWLSQPGIAVIAVTGRDLAAMSRVRLPFSSWQVLDHGATMLEPGGAVHQPWASKVGAALPELQGELRMHHASGLALAGTLGCTVRLHTAHGQPMMLVAKHPGADANALAAMQHHWAAAASPAFSVIANANNVSVLPREPGKAGAVRYLREKIFPDALLSFGLGDSVSDLGFLQACDFALTPSRGQLLNAAAAAGLVQR